jgi:iron-sulfur cluster repair protein YtfE (RIC family)
MNRNTGRIIGAAGVAALGVVAGLALSRSKQTAMKAVMALTGDWERQLKAEHGAIRKLLKAMVDAELTDAARRAELLEALDDVLTRHSIEEEKVIYPALRAAGSSTASALLFADHGEMKTMVRALQELPPADPAWNEAAKALRQLFLRHVKQEEELFPLLHQLGDKTRNKALTQLVRREAVRLS